MKIKAKVNSSCRHKKTGITKLEISTDEIVNDVQWVGRKIEIILPKFEIVRTE